MQFTLDINISAISVFLQGILSFFSPCVLPLIPLYIGYLSGGTMKRDENGNLTFKRSKVIGNTFFFILGVSFAFVLLGLGVSVLGNFLSKYQVLITRAGGLIVLVLGLYQIGIFGSNSILGNTHKLPINLEGLAMSPVTALLMGFTFSFAWTPCVGPALTGVLFMAASSKTQMTGFLLILVYTLGFILPFILVGLFTSSVLQFFKKHMQVVKYTTKVGGTILVLMGALMLTGVLDKVSGTLSDQSVATEKSDNETENEISDETTGQEETGQEEIVPAPDFTLTDLDGNIHTLSEYKGKTIFINFWATWCSPCKQELPHIQTIYEEYEKEGENGLIVLTIVAPEYGREGTTEEIKTYVEQEGYKFPVLLDTTAQVFNTYGITAFPTTFMIDREGKVYGYVTGMLTEDIMHSIIEQTMHGK